MRMNLAEVFLWLAAVLYVDSLLTWFWRVMAEVNL